MNPEYKSIDDLYLIELKNKTLWIQFNHQKDTNPFSRRLTLAITELSQKIESDLNVKSIIFANQRILAIKLFF